MRIKPVVPVLLLWLSALLSPALQAQELIDRVLEAVADQQVSHWAFTETRYSPLLAEPQQLNGELRYQPPDGLQREVLETGERFSIDGEWAEVETAQGLSTRLHLSEVAALEQFSVAVRALLANDRASLEQLFRIETFGTLGDWQLQLQPRIENGGVVQIRAFGQQALFHTLEILETSGDRVVIEQEPLN